MLSKLDTVKDFHNSPVCAVYADNFRAAETSSANTARSVRRAQQALSRSNTMPPSTALLMSDNRPPVLRSTDPAALTYPALAFALNALYAARQRHGQTEDEWHLRPSLAAGRD